MQGKVAEEQCWVVSAADVSAEEGAVVGVAYDGETFPPQLSFYTEASGDASVPPPLPPSHTRSETRSQRGPVVDPLPSLLRGRDRGNCARGGSTELFGCGAAQASEDSLRHPRRRQGVGVSGERLRGDAELCRGGMVAETTGGLRRGHGGATAHVIDVIPIGPASLLGWQRRVLCRLADGITNMPL